MADLSRTPGNPSPFDKDAAYLNQTLRHERMELALDDSVSLQTVGLVLVRALLASFIPLALFVVISMFTLFNAASNSFTGEGGGSGGSGGAVLALVFAVLGGMVFWGVLLGSKVTEPIGEWRVLLTDRWQYAESYHRMIAAALEQRSLPIALQHKRVKLNTANRPVKHTIVLAEGDYQAYVTVFPYGTSLYVGWQMWRRRSGAQLIGRALVDRFGAANIVTAMLRTDRPRAMREAVHLACREAVYQEVTQDRWQRALQVDLGELVEESALLLPQQPPSPVLPPPAPAPMPAAGPAPAPAPAPIPGQHGAPAPQPGAPAAPPAAQSSPQPAPAAPPVQQDQPQQPMRQNRPDAPRDEA